VHGSAPDIAGQGRANPIASLLSGVRMLRHFDEDAGADRLKAAIFRHLARGETRTPDMGGTATTSQVRDAILREIEATPVPA
jgi:isocitrate/isopropylmalate dehydrogenase